LQLQKALVLTMVNDGDVAVILSYMLDFFIQHVIPGTGVEQQAPALFDYRLDCQKIVQSMGRELHSNDTFG
jgi:hypothetical protein